MQLDRRAQGGGRLAGRRPAHPVVLASQFVAAELYQEGHPPADCTPGVGPVNGKETQ